MAGSYKQSENNGNIDDNADDGLRVDDFSDAKHTHTQQIHGTSNAEHTWCRRNGPDCVELQINCATALHIP